MLNQNILEMLNRQMNKEFYSAYLYLAVSCYFNSISLDGFENWTKIQAQEELMHALKIYNYMLERQSKVSFPTIQAIKKEWNSPLEAVLDIYQHERSISESIHELLKTARENHDYPTEVILHWFITEQIEEESMADKISQKLKIIGDDGGALLMMDNQLQKSVSTLATNQA